MPECKILSVFTIFRKGDLGARSLAADQHGTVRDKSEWESLNQRDTQKLCCLHKRKQDILVMGGGGGRKGRAKWKGLRARSELLEQNWQVSPHECLAG